MVGWCDSVPLHLERGALPAPFQAGHHQWLRRSQRWTEAVQLARDGQGVSCCVVPNAVGLLTECFVAISRSGCWGWTRRCRCVFWCMQCIVYIVVGQGRAGQGVEHENGVPVHPSMYSRTVPHTYAPVHIYLTSMDAYEPGGLRRLRPCG